MAARAKLFAELDVVPQRTPDWHALDREAQVRLLAAHIESLIA